MKQDRTARRLFVYGTLAPGQANAHVLAGVAGTWEPATVTGTLVHDGGGSAFGYPAIVLDEGGLQVEGLLFSSESLPEHWQRLDAFEGDGYERVVIAARRPDGSTIEAFIYRLRVESPAPEVRHRG